MRLIKRMLILILTLALCPCSGFASESMIPLAEEIQFDAEDINTACDAGNAVKISLNGSSAECTSGYVEIANNTVTITKGGSYFISGSLSGMIIVHAEKNDTVRIILSGAEIISPDSAAIYVRKAGKTVITSAEGSENRLSNGGKYIDIDESSIDAVIFSRDDLAINGSGLLTIHAADGHGIVSKDSLRMASANLNIAAASHAVSAKDDIGINGGSYVLRSEKDGLHAENKDDSSLGNVLILDGELDIASGGDGVSAGSKLQIDGGSFKIVSGGGYENASPRTDDFMRMRGNYSSEEEDTVSSKGLKAGSDMHINGGSYDIDACDDALHADGSMVISGGSFSILSGDDALHAENNLSVYDGKINIASCYEGLEAHTLDILGGDIALSASDDGLNAAGGNDGSGIEEGFGADNPFSNDPDAFIRISGGIIHISCGGDGIDSNGEIRITGGKTLVHGPVSGGNSSIDCGAGAYIDGGIFAAVGSAQMAEHFSAESTQCSLISNISGSEGSKWCVINTAGDTLFDFTAECDFQCIILSIPDFETGESYRIVSGDTSVDITFDTTLFSDTDKNAFGGMMNRGGRKHGQLPDGFSRGNGGSEGSLQHPEDFTPPNDMQMPPEQNFNGSFTPPDGMQMPPDAEAGTEP